jgi:hypothetical protein
MKEGISSCQVEPKVRGILQTLNSTGFEGGDEKAEPRDFDCKGIQVNTIDCVQRTLDEGGRISAGFSILPLAEEARESRQQKVSATA